jgi:hypothetical protein
MSSNNTIDKDRYCNTDQKLSTSPLLYKQEYTDLRHQVSRVSISVSGQVFLLVLQHSPVGIIPSVLHSHFIRLTPTLCNHRN